jgi:hypothetical protein
MPILSQPAFGPRTALAYITGGLLLDVWTAVYYFAYVRPAGAISSTTWFWLIGLFTTGLVFVLLGVFLGSIGRAARKAELPPEDVVQAEANIQATAAANPPAVAAHNPAMPVAAAGAVPVMPAAAPAQHVAPVAAPVQPAVTR